MNEGLREEYEELLMQVELGRAFEVEVSDPNTPLAIVFAKAKEMAIESTDKLVNADLFTEEGLRDARFNQHRISVFTTIAQMIHGVLESGLQAQDAVAEIEKDFAEEVLRNGETKYSD